MKTKTRTNAAKAIGCLLAAVFLFALCCPFSALTVSASGSSQPSLYANDEVWFKDGRLPFIYESGKYYAPVSFFLSFQGVKTAEDDALSAFIISRGEKFFTFDTMNYNSVVNSLTGIRSFLYLDERYLPVETVCSILGLTYEGLTADGADRYTSIRITDGNEKFTFRELLSLLSDTEVTYTFDFPDKTPACPEKRIYIGIAVTAKEPCMSTLSRLDDSKIKATFFFEPATFEKYPELVYEAVSRGHSIGFICDGTTTAECEAQAELLNDSLEKLIHTRSRLLLCVNMKADTLTYLYTGGYIILSDFYSPGGADKSTDLTAFLSSVDKNGYGMVLLSTGDESFLPLICEAVTSGSYGALPITGVMPE